MQLRATIQSVKVYQRAECTDNPEGLRHLVPIRKTRHPEKRRGSAVNPNESAAHT